MIRTLLATTAVAALLATGALAQDASSSTMESSMMDSSEMPMESSMMSSEAPADSSTMSSEAPMDSTTMSSEAPMDSTTMESSMMSEPMDSAVQPSAPFDIATGYTRVDTDRLASKIIGTPVYSSAATDADNLGNINDLVLDESGDVAAVVLGVGGFLGIGEKQVAVDYASLQWVVADDNTERFVLETTVDELTAAPDFTTVDDEPVDTTSMMSQPLDSNMMAPSAAQ